MCLLLAFFHSVIQPTFSKHCLKLCQKLHDYLFICCTGNIILLWLSPSLIPLLIVDSFPV